jgi:diguanylate cyclase (GGDEF)-like protein
VGKIRHVLATQVFDSAAIATHNTLVNLTSFFFFCGGLAVMIGVVLPGWNEHANMLGIFLIGAAAWANAALIYVLGKHLPKWVFEIDVLVGTSMITLGVYISGSPEAAACIAFLYLCAMFDGALFFGGRGMLIQYAAVLGASLWALTARGVGAGPVAFVEITIAGCALGVAWVARAIHVHELDQLTKLHNRRAFEQRVELELAAKTVGTGQLCLVLFDIDRFQAINRELGWHGADDLLRRVAAVWRENLPAKAMLSRLTGDKFGLLLPGQSISVAVSVADAFRSLLPAGTTASAGVTVQQDGDTPSTLIGRAESAALDAKTCGRDNTAVFGDPTRQATSIEAALHRREFVLEYQPVFQLPERIIVSYEALIRWRQPGRGLISPGHFIPVAEKTGAIVALGQWALDEAARVVAANRLHADGSGGVQGRLPSVAVNASMLELRSPHYADTVARAIARHGIAPQQLTIEVTEAVFDGDNPGVLSTIHALKKIGVKIAIDDFGAGYSSLRWLDRFPADILKIDKSFIDTITGPDQELKVLRSIVNLGQSLGLTVLAEGVENEVQAEVLERMGVERIQGYLLGRPMPLNQGLLPQA